MERPERAHPVVADRPGVWTRPYAAGLAFIPLSLLGGLFPSFSITANLYVLSLGGALLAAGMSGRVPRVATPGQLPAAVSWWLIPVGLFAVIEVAAYAGGSTADFPTLSLLADPLLDGYPIRSAAYFGWLIVFWGMVRR